MFSKSQRSSSIHLHSPANEIRSDRNSLYRTTHSHPQQRRRSCPSPATSSLAAIRRSSVSASSAHYLDAAAAAAAAFPGLNREFSLTLATGLPAGVDDDGPGSSAVRLSSGWDLPSIYRLWEPLLVHGIKDCSWPSPSPDACKVAAARELQHTAGVFAI
jgi:hypothetical protein